MEGYGEHLDPKAGLSSGPSQALTVEPSPEEIAEYKGLRRREMGSIADRLGRFPKMPWARLWGAGAGVLIGGAIGGALAALQLGSETDKTAYWGIVGGTFVVGVLMGLAALTTHAQRTDSIEAIKEDLDRLLGETPPAKSRQG